MLLNVLNVVFALHHERTKNQHKRKPKYPPVCQVLELQLGKLGVVQPEVGLCQAEKAVFQVGIVVFQNKNKYTCVFCCFCLLRVRR